MGIIKGLFGRTREKTVIACMTLYAELYFPGLMSIDAALRVHSMALPYRLIASAGVLAFTVGAAWATVYMLVQAVAWMKEVE